MKRETSERARMLPSNWSTMTDIDRAEAVKRLLDAGLSGRKLAEALNCSESLIRHLKPLAQASPEENRLARLGKISTRELRRRIAERKAEKAHKKEQAAEQARAGGEELAFPGMAGVEIKTFWFAAHVSCAWWSILAQKFPQSFHKTLRLFINC